MEDGTWTIGELADLAAMILAADGSAQVSGRVRDLPNERLIRWYTTIGILDPPVGRRGRSALYGYRHLLQLIAIKRRQATGLALAEIQLELGGAPDGTLARVAGLPLHPGRDLLTGLRPTGTAPEDDPTAGRADPTASPAQPAGHLTEPGDSADLGDAHPGRPVPARSPAPPSRPDPERPGAPAAAPAGAHSAASLRPSSRAGHAPEATAGGEDAHTDVPARPAGLRKGAADALWERAAGYRERFGLQRRDDEAISVIGSTRPSGAAEPHRDEFWKTRPDVTYGGPAGPPDYSVPEASIVQGVRLVPGVTVLLDVPASLTGDDIAALEEAAQPLLDELRHRGLLPESPAPLPTDPSRRSQ